MGKIIGIDLGTTNSLAACWKDGKSVLIPNSLGQYLTPSVVSIDENGIVYVGEIAKERLVTHPECTVNVFKRSMGTDRKYMLGDKEYSADQLSALVLNSLKLDAERFLGEPVEEAVISVPAYFGDKARKATRNAGILAGLKVDRIVNEPSAAALAYKCMNDLPDGKLMVYDFGGGTLDVSLVDCFENIVEIIAVNGDNRLGGADFDTVLAEYFCAEQGLNLHRLDKSTQGIVIRAAERAKRVLTVSEDAEMKVSCDKLSASLIITRKKLIQISMKLFNRMSVPVKAVLQDGQLSSSQLLGAVLVGGSCKMPVVQQYLRFLLRDVNIEAVNPDYMVALGVGMFAGLKESGGKAQDVILTDICPFSLGTGVKNPADPQKDLMSVIIPRNSPLPSSRVQTYCTASDNQRAIMIGIFQGEDMYVNNNIKLEQIHFDNIPKLPKGEVSVTVRFTYDINGILCVDATVLNTGEEQNLILGADDQSEETKRKIAELSELKKDVREIDSIKLIEERAQRIYQQLTVMTVKAELSARIQQFSMLLVAQDIYQLRKEAAIFSSYLDEIENNYLSESGIDDGYMDDFLQWYEENGENDEPQGWTP